MSYQHAVTTHEFNDAKVSFTGRLSPIGRAHPDDRRFSFAETSSINENLTLLEERERLNASLAALTRHVAHVQLRLQQVISAPTPEDREHFLLELHEFASHGIPEVMCQMSIQANEQVIEAEKCREKDFINELKHKLDELEHYAAASGSLEGVPTSVTLEKQRVLIDQLRQKLDMQLDETSVSKLSTEELGELVDQAINQLTNPAKLRENLINQMRTEISDLEKYIIFLKDSVHASIPSEPLESPLSPSPQPGCYPLDLCELIKKFVVVTGLYTFFLLSCGTRSIERSSRRAMTQRKKDRRSKNHFGDLRARFEIAIGSVLQAAARTISIDHEDSNTTSDIEEDDQHFTVILSSIRHDLTRALRALLEHGLYEESSPVHSSTWSCLSTSICSRRVPAMHIWKLFLKYYELKQGHEYVNSPAQKLSRSFSLLTIGGKPITPKQHLLTAIDTIVRLHKTYSKQMDDCFKSFLCYALNEKKLVTYLRLILKTELLIENHYYPWSYIKQTGFNDALHSLDRLTPIDFQLPIDTSVRRFLDNRDLIE